MFDSPLPQQLALLRDLTNRTGILHDAQRLQLSMWPRIVFSHCYRSEASPVVQYDDEGKITSRALDISVFCKGKTPTNMEQAKAALVQWVHNLLGPEWEVRMEFLAAPQPTRRTLKKQRTKKRRTR